MLSSLYYSALRGAGLTALARRLRGGALILCYHDVVPAAAPPGPTPPAGDPGLHLTADRFERQVRWLLQHYTIVPLLELATRIGAGVAVRGLAALTFDDGYTGTFTHAWPLLRRLGVPATVFVVAQAPGESAGFWWDHPVAAAATPPRRERWLTELRGDGALITASLAAGAAPSQPPTHRPATWSVIARAATDGLDIGVHSASHRTLTTLGDAELETEVQAAGKTIASRAGVEPVVFSYPYGIWDARARRAVRAAGYRAAVTLDYGLNAPAADLWSLRRINVPAAISQPAFAGWTAGIRPRRRQTAQALGDPGR